MLTEFFYGNKVLAAFAFLGAFLFLFGPAHVALTSRSTILALASGVRAYHIMLPVLILRVKNFRSQSCVSAWLTSFRSCGHPKVLRASTAFDNG